MTFKTNDENFRFKKEFENIRDHIYSLNDTTSLSNSFSLGDQMSKYFVNSLNLSLEYRKNLSYKLEEMMIFCNFNGGLCTIDDFEFYYTSAFG